MLRYLIENVYGWVTFKMYGAYRSVALEVFAYMLIFNYLTKNELKACIENYEETIEYFKNEADEDPSLVLPYAPMIQSLENMLKVFRLEQNRRNG